MNEQHEGSSMGRSAWQSQALDAPPISLAFIHRQVEKLNADYRSHTAWMYAALVALVIAVTVRLLNPAPIAIAMGNVTRTGMILAVLGALYVTWEVRRRRSKLVARPDESVLQSLDAYRAELQRRRDYYLDSWRWSLLPMLPALLVLIVGGVLDDDSPRALLHHVLMGVFAVAVTLLGVWHYRRIGRDFQRELDALDTLKRG